MIRINLDPSRQNQIIYLVLLKKKGQDEELVTVVKSRYDFISWLSGQKWYKDDDSCFLDLNESNEHTFDNGIRVRLQEYQINDYAEY